MTTSMGRSIVHSTLPYNAEPTSAALRAGRITPQDTFYVRSHGDVPVVDPDTFVLTVSGLVATPLRLTLDDLGRLPRHEIEATVQCAGNRRADLHALHPVAGDPWQSGAIGNAVWSGVRLADVLTRARPDDAAARHVAFSSLDEVEVDGQQFRFGVSIPLAKALAPEVLLATAMNGAPLSPEHGFPLRVVTPGFAGVRSPKWLAAIEVRAQPSDCPIQAADYKLLPSDITSTDAIDWRRGITINEMPVNAAICEPIDGAALMSGPVTVRGWAMAAGRTIDRVDVSADGGATWVQADRETGSHWSWTFWSATLDVRPGTHQLAVRAFDSAGQTQPGTAAETWNVKGYLAASWHRIAVTAR